MIDVNALLQSMTNRIILVTVVVYVLVEALFAGAPNVFEMYSWQTSYFEYWQLLSHVFLHGGFTHLLFNMMGLWFFGQVLERVWGKQRFLIFYLACGVGAAVISQIIDQYLLNQVSDRMVGASGAIYGILVAFAMLFPNQKVMLIFLPVPIPAKVFVPILLLIDLTGGFTGISIFGSNIAHFAHIGGAIVGFCLCLMWLKKAR
ncbi:rhomboid family intramembrane serine protease [Arenicella sp. 4NH20-0111]|uniref:rhomboid family intramembrane serine protease n=1 Tax=Arenicella sp. 4NH20-0111 TaxID=3127648 RepID=UPI00310BCA54